MAQRAYWTGFLKISLVSFPVNLYTATSSSSRVAFHQLHKETKKRIKLVPHEPELGAVSREDLVKGYEFERGKYVVIDQSELDRIKIESARTIEVERFVKEGEIDELYVDNPYYLAPDGPIADESFRVFVEAMKRRKVAGIARVVLGGRERVVALKPRSKAILLTTLRHGEEVRALEPYIEDLGSGKLDKELLELAERLIDQRIGGFDPNAFTDRYAEAVLELVKSKIAGETFEVIERATPSATVVSLMEALRQSVEDVEEMSKKPPARSARRRALKKQSS
ncbi:MAG: Ku protein [Planctomycetota bacterium]|nr:Ku protein [Planctomycetota bacterium]